MPVPELTMMSSTSTRASKPGTSSEPLNNIDDLSDRSPFERALQIAVAFTLVMVMIRMVWLWHAGVIRTEPFLGSAGWNVAIPAPGLGWLGAWFLMSIRIRSSLARRLHPLTSRAPLTTWHRRIASHDWRLELGLRSDVSSLVREVTDRYGELDVQSRASVRALWRAYPSFAATASTGEDLTSVDAMRRALFLFSIRDQRPDARDELLWLDTLARSARRAGIDFAPLAREAAMLSDVQGRDAVFGSTRDTLQRYVD
jgi:hypothetical protein